MEAVEGGFQMLPVLKEVPLRRNSKGFPNFTQTSISGSVNLDYELSESSGADVRWAHVIPPKETWPARRDLFSTGQPVQKNEVPAAFSMVGER
jgi:hypothetical protein